VTILPNRAMTAISGTVPGQFFNEKQEKHVPQIFCVDPLIMI
jgi:hypothetical protein